MDLDNDGLDDMVWAAESTEQLSWTRKSSSNLFTDSLTTSTVTQDYPIKLVEVADMNRDGRRDFVCATGSSVLIFHNWEYVVVMGQERGGVAGNTAVNRRIVCRFSWLGGLAGLPCRSG